MKKQLKSIGTLLMVGTILMSQSATTFAAELGDDISLEASDDVTVSGDSDSSEYSIEPAWLITKKYKVTGNSVNIRTGAGTSYAVVGTLYKGDIIYVKSIDNGWAKFKYNGQWRYVSSSYIKAA